MGTLHGGVDFLVQERLYEWSTLLESLITVAKTQPQAAYSAFDRSVQSECIFLQGVLQHCGPLFAPLMEIISQKLLPTIFSSEVSPIERELFSLPARMGGLNILNPTDTNECNYSASCKLTETITEALKKKTLFDPD